MHLSADHDAVDLCIERRLRVPYAPLCHDKVIIRVGRGDLQIVGRQESAHHAGFLRRRRELVFELLHREKLMIVR